MEIKRGMAPDFDKDTLELVRRVHVSMPWKYIHDYLETILAVRMNVEIGFDAEELDRTSRSDFQSVAVQLMKEGCRVTLHGPFWDLHPGSIDPIIRQVSRFRLSQFFDLLDVFRPIQVVCHTGFDPRHHEGHHRFWVDQSLAVWEPLVKRGEALGISVLLENVWELNPEFHLELFQQIDSRFFGFCLDVGHQHSFSKTPLSIWLEALSEYLREIHLHDNDGSGDDHLPIGQGNIDFGMLFGFLRAKGKSPLLTLEPHREEHVGESLAGLKRVMSIEG